ncbi:MMPL family transporter [Dissulfurirhabdus thermomarina]|uniref:MMPL family transporter n=2 Tax=Dissulfurirhabdus thermomarina TaxID=1765737 RepID=A0A6N9TSR2_DISTH|nr:MMPL family transporter [Dissulfurirhabdus thermomarina]NDY41576.1 MMPL family transporter [Dissulfurirhabdus thermomarina]NMX22369.1 MMPL family transporter [Dissulfurirhabdus thermomarina]
MVALTLLLALGAALPTLWPERFPFLKPLHVDTDPENMLRQDEPVRVFHDRMKRVFSLHDILVLGVVNERDPDGVFNPDSLRRIFDLADYAKGLQWDDPEHPGRRAGVIAVDIIAPSTVDNIEQGGLGSVRFEWLMPTPPKTRAEARAIRDKARRLPFLQGTLVSEDGKAICLYIPLTSKKVSYRVASRLREKIRSFGQVDDQYHITGLPVANDTFGVEMFRQMAISAPMAMAIIFLLMLFFFRKLVMILSPMIVALVSVICTMGLLIVTGKTVHIMSSMIPVFIMPIAVLDSVHILSEFFDRYPRLRDRRRTVLEVMDELFMPMLYTSLTSAAGFASLALTPIPPVQVFGLYVAAGVMLAWVFTVTFVPAYVMFIPERSLAGFGFPAEGKVAPGNRLSRFLAWLGNTTYRRAKFIVVLAVAMMGAAAYGISLIQINDNPVKWFTHSHPIRIADKVLNRHFGGTYMAYLTLTPEAGPAEDVASYAEGLAARLEAAAKRYQDLPGAAKVFGEAAARARAQARRAESAAALLDDLDAFVAAETDRAPEALLDAWDEVAALVSGERQRGQVFKDPAVLRYLARLQEELLRTGVVGKSNSVTDLVKTVHRELFLGDDSHFTVPDTREAVAQCLITYQNSHRPQDLWHFVTPDYRRASIWVQLRSGDNKDMMAVVRHVDAFLAQNPPPVPLRHDWYGLTYINVVWQAKMVSGMLQAFLGSFLVVFFMMTLLFRSALWGFLCMVPLTVTIAFIYGLVGYAGKDYDMPIAVLSALTLGLAVDFAIHFLARSRNMVAVYGTWERTAGPMFEEPARAITRNIVVIALGFLPLLAAPLVPYKTVGTFMALILSFAGIVTLMLLPALVRLLERRLFPGERPAMWCRCLTCIILAVTLVLLVAVNLQQYLDLAWRDVSWAGVAAVVILGVLCRLASKAPACAVSRKEESK